jgi:hypothetical protein
MSRKLALLWAGVLLLGTSGAWADEDGVPNAEATIRLMDEADAELPDAVMNEVTLPDLPASSKGADGLVTAEENQGRRDTGQDVADGTLENARDNANSVAEDALENVEQRGRSEEHRQDDPPGPPDQPGPPD